MDNEIFYEYESSPQKELLIGTGLSKLRGK